MVLPLFLSPIRRTWKLTSTLYDAGSWSARRNESAPASSTGFVYALGTVVSHSYTSRLPAPPLLPHHLTDKRRISDLAKFVPLVLRLVLPLPYLPFPRAIEDSEILKATVMVSQQFCQSWLGRITITHCGSA